MTLLTKTPAPTEADFAVSRDLQNAARWLDKRLERVAGERYGFCLITFGFGEAGVTSYVSNVERADAIDALTELLNRWRANDPDPPVHTRQ